MQSPRSPGSAGRAAEIPPFCTAIVPGHHRHSSPNEARRSLIIQEKCGTFTVTDRLSAVLCSHERGEAMKKTLVALAAVATLAISAVAAPPPAPPHGDVAGGLAVALIVAATVAGVYAPS